jgi:hypothetical protein
MTIKRRAAGVNVNLHPAVKPEELNVDAVFAKLKKIGGKSEDEGES